MLEQLLPPNVIAVEAFEDRLGESVFPGEEDLIANAVEIRRREFITARRCAREALARLGYPPVPIRSGPKREPLWPTGVIGSITHTHNFRAAAVARQNVIASVGIDAEQNNPLPDGVEESITVAAEPEMLAALAFAQPRTHWGRVLLSAKEAVYKAWYPLTGRWLDFTDAELKIHPRGAFTAKLLIGVQRHERPPLTEVSGRYTLTQSLIATAVTIPTTTISHLAV